MKNHSFDFLRSKYDSAPALPCNLLSNYKKIQHIQPVDNF